MRKTANIKPHKFRAFVDFVNKEFGEFDPINPRITVQRKECPVRDEETASKYLFTMQRWGLLSLKSIYSNGKVYFKGCSLEQEINIRRRGLEGWVGLRISDFLNRHPLMGAVLIRRLYEHVEYGEVLFPNIHRFFPALASNSRRFSP